MTGVLGAPSGAMSSCATSPVPTVTAGEPFSQLSCGVCTRTLRVYRLRPGAMAVFCRQHCLGITHPMWAPPRHLDQPFGLASRRWARRSVGGRRVLHRRQAGADGPHKLRGIDRPAHPHLRDGHGRVHGRGAHEGHHSLRHPAPQRTPRQQAVKPPLGQLWRLGVQAKLLVAVPLQAGLRGAPVLRRPGAGEVGLDAVRARIRRLRAAFRLALPALPSVA